MRPTCHSRRYTLGPLDREFRAADGTGFRHPARHRNNRSLANDPQINRQRVRVQAIGKLKLLPASTLAAICAAREGTAGYNGMGV